MDLKTATSHISFINFNRTKNVRCIAAKLSLQSAPVIGLDDAQRFDLEG